MHAVTAGVTRRAVTERRAGRSFLDLAATFRAVLTLRGSAESRTRRPVPRARSRASSRIAATAPRAVTSRSGCGSPHDEDGHRREATAIGFVHRAGDRLQLTVLDNLSRVRERTAAACTRVGRDPGEVTIVAAGKTVEPRSARLGGGRRGSHGRGRELRPGAP